MQQYHISAGNMTAHYDLGHIFAESEEDAIQQAKKKHFVGCSVGLTFRAQPCNRNHKDEE